MRAIIFATVIAIVSWMVFGSMNELTSAHDEGGCCGKGNCGQSSFTGMIWNANLAIAVIATVIALYGGARMTPQGRALPPIPFLPV